MSVWKNFLNRSTFGNIMRKTLIASSTLCVKALLQDEPAWDMTWWAGTVCITASQCNNRLLLDNLDSVINKCQTGVMSTTNLVCYWPTDTVSDWTIVFASVLSRRLSSWLMDIRTSVGHSVGISAWSPSSRPIFLSVNKMVLTSLGQYFWATMFWMADSCMEVRFTQLWVTANFEALMLVASTASWPNWFHLLTLGKSNDNERVQCISDLHSKFALRPHHVPKYGKHPISDRWD